MKVSIPGILNDIKLHATDTFNVLQSGNFEEYSACVRHTWKQKQQLDTGTNPPKVQKIISLINDYASSYKLPGAGGGGYLYIIAKDTEAAGRIRTILNENPPNKLARFC